MDPKAGCFFVLKMARRLNPAVATRYRHGCRMHSAIWIGQHRFPIWTPSARIRRGGDEEALEGRLRKPLAW